MKAHSMCWDRRCGGVAPQLYPAVPYQLPLSRTCHARVLGRSGWCVCAAATHKQQRTKQQKESSVAEREAGAQMDKHNKPTTQQDVTVNVLQHWQQLQAAVSQPGPFPSSTLPAAISMVAVLGVYAAGRLLHRPTAVKEGHADATHAIAMLTPVSDSTVVASPAKPPSSPVHTRQQPSISSGDVCTHSTTAVVDTPIKDLHAEHASTSAPAGAEAQQQQPAPFVTAPAKSTSSSGSSNGASANSVSSSGVNRPTATDLLTRQQAGLTSAQDAHVDQVQVAKSALKTSQHKVVLLEAMVGALREKLNEEEDRNTHLHAEVIAGREELAREHGARSEAEARVQALQQDVQAAQTALQQAQERVQQLEGRLEELIALNQQLQASITQLEAQVAVQSAAAAQLAQDAEARISAVQAGSDQSVSHVAELHAALAQRERELQEAKEKLAGYEAALADKDSQLQQEQDAVQQLDKLLTTQEQQLKTATHRAEQAEALLETTSADMRAGMEEAMALVQTREAQVAQLKQLLQDATAKVEAEASQKAIELDEVRGKLEVALRMARAEAESSKRQLDQLQHEIEAVLRDVDVVELGDERTPGSTQGGKQGASVAALAAVNSSTSQQAQQLIVGGAGGNKELQQLSERQMALSTEIDARRKALEQQASQLLPHLPSELAAQVHALMSRHAALLSELQQAEATWDKQGAGAQHVSRLRRDLQTTSTGLAMLLRTAMTAEQLACERAVRAELQDRETELRAVTATIMRLQQHLAPASDVEGQLPASIMQQAAQGEPAAEKSGDRGLAALLGQRLRELLRQRDAAVAAAAAAKASTQEHEQALESRLRERELALMTAAKEREEARQAEVQQLQERLTAQTQQLADRQQADTTAIEQRYRQQLEATRVELATRIKEAEAAWRQQLEAAQVAAQLASNERQRLAAEVTLGAMQARQQLSELSNVREELKARAAQLEDVKHAYESSQAAAERRASQAAAEAALAAGQVEALQAALQEREKEVHELKQLEQQSAAAAHTDHAAMPSSDMGRTSNGTHSSGGSGAVTHVDAGAAPPVQGGRELFTPSGWQASDPRSSTGGHPGSNGVHGPAGASSGRARQAAAARELSNAVVSFIDTALGPTSPQETEERIMTTRAAAAPAVAPASVPAVTPATAAAPPVIMAAVPVSAPVHKAATHAGVEAAATATAATTQKVAVPATSMPVGVTPTTVAPAQPADQATTMTKPDLTATASDVAALPVVIATEEAAHAAAATGVQQHVSALDRSQSATRAVQPGTDTSPEADIARAAATAPDTATLNAPPQAGSTATTTTTTTTAAAAADTVEARTDMQDGTAQQGEAVHTKPTAIGTGPTASTLHVHTPVPSSMQAAAISTSITADQSAMNTSATTFADKSSSLAQALDKDQPTLAAPPTSNGNVATPAATTAAVASDATAAAAAHQATQATVKDMHPPVPDAAAADADAAVPPVVKAAKSVPHKQHQTPAQPKQATDGVVKGTSNTRAAPTIMPSSMWGHAKPMEAPAAADTSSKQAAASSAFPSTEDLGAEINRIAQSLVQRQSQPQQAAATTVSKAAQPVQRTAAPARLQLVCGASMQPHDAKAATGGEDAFFLCYRTVHAMGVADGVGGWATEGVDVSAYARGICDAMRTALETQQVKSATAAMEAAQQTVQLPGSCTTCIALLHPEQQQLEVASLGDSSLRVVRGGEVVAATQVQEHAFNMPYQLACPHLFPDTDLATDARQYKFKVQPGDIIVLATDGLWDNLWEEQVVSLLRQMMPAADKEVATSSLARRMAQQLTQAANAAARDPTSRTPWAVEHADATGNMLARLFPRGGKMDDITTCVAIVTAAQQ